MIDERYIGVCVCVYNEVINEIPGLTERSVTRTRASGRLACVISLLFSALLLRNEMWRI